MFRMFRDFRSILGDTDSKSELHLEPLLRQFPRLMDIRTFGIGRDRDLSVVFGVRNPQIGPNLSAYAGQAHLNNLFQKSECP